MSTIVTPTLLKTKHHFIILDGLRGVAAIAVVIFHFMEIVLPDYQENVIAHAYLAVDFFFCLSGFVIAYAYDTRLPKLGVINFFKLRLIRLHPLVIVGSIVGLLCFIFDPYSNLFEKYGTGQTVLMFLSSCFMIPYPLVAERSFNLFHLNPPSWSLFWEYVANVVYALVIVKISNKALWITTFVAALLLLYECRAAGYLGVGWGGDNVMGGAIRVFYSFTAGILVYRMKWRIASDLGFIAVSILLLAAFFVPFKTFQINRLVDAAIVMFYFPFLVALGAGAKLRPAFTEICKWSGEISYPLYMLHYGFMWIFLSYMEKNKPTNGHLAVLIPVCTIVLILFSQLVLVYIDKPIRKALKIQ